MTQVSQQPRL